MSNRQSKSIPGWSLEERDPKFIESFMPIWEWFYRNYFRVRTDGWENVPTEDQVLIVGSHNGGMAAPDMIMMMYDWFRRYGTERLVYGLMHPHIWKINSDIAKLGEKTGAIAAHPKAANAALKRGASVLVYPGGQYDLFRPYNQRYNINFAGNKGFIKLALRQEVPIIPAISVGAHETLIVLGDFYEIMKQFNNMGLPWLYNLDPGVFPIYLGLPWGLAIGPLPNIPFPVQISTRICKPIIFEKYGREASKNRDYVDDCYSLVCTEMQREMDKLAREVSIIRNS